MDKLLPLNTGTGTMFGESVRHYQTISMASPPGDALGSSITIETDAYAAVLNYEKILKKWVYYDTVLDTNTVATNTSPATVQKKTPIRRMISKLSRKERSPSSVFTAKSVEAYTLKRTVDRIDMVVGHVQGWSVTRHCATLQNRDAEAQTGCEKLEEASLKQVRINHGKSAKTYEEEQNNKRKKPESSGPVDDNFTTALR